MAVTACNYEKDTPIVASFDDRGRGTYTVRYQVVCNTAMAPADVLAGARTTGTNQISAKYATFSHFGGTDSSAYHLTSSVSPKFAKDSQFYWTVAVNYSPLQPGQKSGDMVANPVSRPAEFWWDREVYPEVLDKDREGKPIVNTAGQPFDEPIEQDATRGVLVAEKNVASLATVVAYNRTYENAVNQTTWTLLNLPARTVLCREVSSGKLITEGIYSYYRVTFRFAIKEDNKTWDREILNRGFKAKDIANLAAPAKPIKRNGETISEPVLLKQDGTDAEDDTTLAYFVPFRTYREVNFAPLNTILA